MRLKTVPCPGEANRNAFIDSCGLCAPLWGELVVPYDACWHDLYLRDPIYRRSKANFIRDRQAALRVIVNIDGKGTRAMAKHADCEALASAIASELSRGTK